MDYTGLTVIIIRITDKLIHNILSTTVYYGFPYYINEMLNIFKKKGEEIYYIVCDKYIFPLMI